MCSLHGDPIIEFGLYDCIKCANEGFETGLTVDCQDLEVTNVISKYSAHSFQGMICRGSGRCKILGVLLTSQYCNFLQSRNTSNRVF